MFRWDLHQAEISDRVFAENWGIYKDLSELRSGWISLHRERAMFTSLPHLPKQLNRPKVKRALLKFYQPHILTLDTKQNNEAPLVPRSHPQTVRKKRELNCHENLVAAQLIRETHNPALEFQKVPRLAGWVQDCLGPSWPAALC